MPLTAEINSSQRSHLHGPCFAKFLVNNSAAGSLIGKNGITIAAAEKETGTIMKLSSTTTFFPNTQDRILTISGSEQSICKAILLIIEKICFPCNSCCSRFTDCEDALNFLDDDSLSSHYNKTLRASLSVKLIVPKSSISSLIGKGGSRIKTMQDTLNCRIHVYNRASGISERVVVSIGELESLKKAVISLVLMFQNDTSLKEYASVIYPSVSSNYKFTAYIDIANRLELTNTVCKISINIPETTVGSVIGPNGSSLDQVISSTGAQIKIFPKDPVSSGSSYRKATLTGSVSAVHMAHALILVKIEGIGGSITSKDVYSFDDLKDDMKDIHLGSNGMLGSKIHSYNHSCSSYNSSFSSSFVNFGSNSLNRALSQTTTLSNSLKNYNISGNDDKNSLSINELSSFETSPCMEWG